jgi:hypothetical protein
MGVPLPPLLGRGEARARRGLPGRTPVLASFGHINPYKRLEAVFRSLHVLRELYPDLSYLLVGSVSANYDVHAAVARAGLDQVVSVTGYVDRMAFEDYVAAADICVNLRHPTAGETSASLLRLLGAGRPTLVTASGSFAELPPGVAAQVDADAGEGELIAATCRLLLDRPDLAAALGENARGYVAREHSLEGSAAGYMHFLSARYGWGEVRKLREGPLWEPAVESVVPGPWSVADRQTTANTRQETTDNRQGTAGAVAASLAELGATEDDHALLAGAARALAELFGGQQERR